MEKRHINYSLKPSNHEFLGVYVSLYGSLLSRGREREKREREREREKKKP